MSAAGWEWASKQYHAIKWINFDLSPDVYIKLLYEMSWAEPSRAEWSSAGLVGLVVWFLRCVFRKCKCACDKWQWQFIGIQLTSTDVLHVATAICLNMTWTESTASGANIRLPYQPAPLTNLQTTKSKGKKHWMEFHLTLLIAVLHKEFQSFKMFKWQK